MKIIFDSEKEKELFINTVSPFFCPADVILDCDATLSKRGCLETCLCEHCWEKNLNLEVKED